MPSSELHFLHRSLFTQPYDTRDMQGCLIAACPKNARWVCVLVVTTRGPAEPSVTTRHDIHLCHEHADAAIEGRLMIPVAVNPG